MGAVASKKHESNNRTVYKQGSETENGSIALRYGFVHEGLYLRH